MSLVRLIKPTFLLLSFLPFAACGDDAGDDDDDDDAVADAADIDSGGTIDAAGDDDDDIDAAPIADASLVDAPPGAFDCLGDPLPTEAPDTVTISGTTFSVGFGGQTPESGVDVEAFDADDNSLGSDTSDGAGGFSFSVNTGGEPVAGYMLATGDTFMDTYLYPPYPIAADIDNASGLMVTPEIFGLLDNLVGETQDEGQGFVGILVIDCNNEPVQGATVTTNPAGQVHYNGDNGIPSADATSTNADGLAVVFNVEPGDVTVDATAFGMSLREHIIEVRADVITTTIVAP